MEASILKRFLSTKTAAEFDALKQELGIEKFPFQGAPMELQIHWGKLHGAWPEDPWIDEDPSWAFSEFGSVTDVTPL